jgi:hypothetical protein
MSTNHTKEKPVKEDSTGRIVANIAVLLIIWLLFYRYSPSLLFLLFGTIAVIGYFFWNFKPGKPNHTYVPIEFGKYKPVSLEGWTMSWPFESLSDENQIDKGIKPIQTDYFVNFQAKKKLTNNNHEFSSAIKARLRVTVEVQIANELVVLNFNGNSLNDKISKAEHVVLNLVDQWSQTYAKQHNIFDVLLDITSFKKGLEIHLHDETHKHGGTADDELPDTGYRITHIIIDEVEIPKPIVEKMEAIIMEVLDANRNEIRSQGLTSAADAFIQKMKLMGVDGKTALSEWQTAVGNTKTTREQKDHSYDLRGESFEKLLKLILDKI